MRGIDLTWRGGEHTFALTIDLLRALQERCDAGPAFVLSRLRASQWLIDDVIQPIRLGLEGGGLSKEESRQLTKRFVEDRPLTESVLTAAAILMHALYGGEEEQELGEAKAAAGKSQTRSREAKSGSRTSTNGQASFTEISDQ